MKSTRKEQKHLQRLKTAEKRCQPLPNEVFKEHPHHEGIWVSNFGRVVNRRMPYPHLRSLTVWPPSPYQYVIINPGHTKVYVHTLVAETFHGLRPKGELKSGQPLYTVSHLDNDPTNNYANNLMWETLKDNLKRSPTPNRYKYTDQQVKSWKRLHKNYNIPIAEIAATVGVDYTIIKKGIDRA